MLSSTFLAVAAIFSTVQGRPFSRTECDTAHCKRSSSTLAGANALQASTDYVVCTLSQEASLAVAALGLGSSSMAVIVCVEPGVSASTTSSNVVASKPKASAAVAQLEQSLAATATADSVSISSASPSTAVLAEQQFHSSSSSSSTTNPTPSTTSSTSYYSATYTPLPASYSSSSATASAASSTSTSTSVCSPTNPKGCNDQQLALNAHNVARASHHVEPLVWSDKLAAAATTWAKKCEWAHSQGSLFPASYVYGENLFASTLTEPDISMASVVAAFMDEESSYDYNNPAFSPTAGQFTQVVWAATREVGCAIVTCDLGIFGDQSTQSTLSVCNYYPSGNYISEFADNVHAP